MEVFKITEYLERSALPCLSRTYYHYCIKDDSLVLQDALTVIREFTCADL